jgi:hypothetical protein
MKTKFTALLIFLFTLNSFGQTFTYNGINYTVLTPTTAQVASNPGFFGAANIPFTVNNGVTNFTVTNIGQYAFQNCTSLSSVTIPNSVTTIGLGAFDSCTGLTSVNIPNSVTSIISSAFSSCTSLTSITIPNSVTSIGQYAFYGCTGLTSINIPTSVTNIEPNTFGYCSGLTSVTIPNLVTSIGFGAFFNCTGLTAVTISNSVTSIGQFAFQNCTGLTSVAIPNSITSIGNFAFYNCTGLTSVTVNWTTPLSVDASVFSGLNLPNISLIVPTGTATIYDATPVWTDFNIATLGINELEFKNNKLIFYPNPASNLITIQTKANKIENFEYKIVDLTGRIVKSGNSKFNEKINIESLESGNYIVQIETEKGEKLSEKIIKN